MDVWGPAVVAILFAVGSGLWWLVGIKQLRQGVIYSHRFEKKYPRDQNPIKFGCVSAATLAIAILMTLIALGLFGAALLQGQ